MSESIAAPESADGSRKVSKVSEAVIRIAGNSQDGIQSIGGFLARLAGRSEQEVMTFMTIPSTISGGPSIFQVRLSSGEVLSSGDEADVLMAFYQHSYDNHTDFVKEGGIILYDTAHVEPNPELEKKFRHIGCPIAELTVEAIGGTAKDKGKNIFALGLVARMFDLDGNRLEGLIAERFKGKPESVTETALSAFHAGNAYPLTTLAEIYEFEEPNARDTEQVVCTGNEALGYGILASGVRFGAGYPITPWSDIMELLRRELPKYDGIFVQCEDEIAAVSMAIGASWGGRVAITGSSGPGISLKGEAIGLGVITELPIVVINIQRGGPSTGLPTKTEQSDLNQAMFGRNGECPSVVIACQSPSDCFETAFEACKISLEFMVPVVLLSDGYIANGSEPWKLPDLDKLPKINTKIIQKIKDEKFLPYKRDEKTLSRDWAIPGTAGLEHRIGGLEKTDGTGNVSYDPDNHHHMVELRQKKIDIISNFIPEVKPYGKDKGDLLILGWGGTYGAIRAAVEKANKNNLSVSHIHLKHINPLPKNLGEVLLKYNKVLIPEINLGQLSNIIRSKYLIDTLNYNRVSGKPFTTSDIYNKISEILEDK